MGDRDGQLRDFRRAVRVPWPVRRGGRGRQAFPSGCVCARLPATARGADRGDSDVRRENHRQTALASSEDPMTPSLQEIHAALTRLPTACQLADAKVKGYDVDAVVTPEQLVAAAQLLNNHGFAM